MSDQTPIERAPMTHELKYVVHECENKEPDGTRLVSWDLHREDADGFTWMAEFQNKEDAEFTAKAFNTAHVEAQRPVSYAMSKDYEALYDHLCNGGEALGFTYDGQGSASPARVSMKSDRWVQIEYIDDFGVLDQFETDEGASSFTAECTRLNLEWLAPAQPPTLDQIMEVVKDWVLDWCDWTMMEDGKDLRERLNKMIG